MKRSRNKLYQFVAAACLPISLTAQAQLEEVIVTAQKPAESLQDVPISISTVSGEKIQDNTILNFAALADFVPSLHIADAAEHNEAAWQAELPAALRELFKLG